MPVSGTGVNFMNPGSDYMTQRIQADVLNLVGNSSNAAARNHVSSSDSRDTGFMNLLAERISEMNRPPEQVNNVSFRDIREAEPREDISPRERPAVEERAPENAQAARERSDEPDPAVSRFDQSRDPENNTEREMQKPDEHDNAAVGNESDAHEKTETAAVNEKEEAAAMEETAGALLAGAPGKTMEFLPDVHEPMGQVDRLLSMIREMPGDNAALNDIKEGLLQLKEFLRNGEEPQRFEALLKDLKTKIETVLRDAAVDGRDASRLLEALRDNAPDLKREFARLSEMMSRYSEHAARPSGERPVEGEQKVSVAVSVERSGSVMESLRSGGTGNESSQGNNDSNIGFNQFRQGQQFTRAGAAPDNMARMQNFNDQLQSMLNNSRLVVKDGKNGHFTMQLFPESMGRVNVRLGLEDGIIHGRFLVDSHEARDQMLENLGALRQKMAEAGIAVGEFQVNVRQQQEQFAGKNREEDSDAPGAGVQLDPGQQYELGAVVRHDGSFDMTA